MITSEPLSKKASLDDGIEEYNHTNAAVKNSVEIDSTPSPAFPADVRE